MRLAIAVITLALAGCANMDPALIKAMEGQAGAVCVTGAGWNGSPVAVQYTQFGGKSVGTAGGGGVAECGAAKFTFTNEGKVVPPQPAKVTP